MLSNYYSDRVIAEVINSTFTFSDLSPRFKDVDETYGNIFCPFHENRHSPAARMYWDENRGIWVLHCFGECHTNFTAYDYVNLVLCKKYNKYRNPIDFLKSNLSIEELKSKLKKANKESSIIQETRTDFIKNYINDVSIETNNIVDYVEKLYTA